MDEPRRRLVVEERERVYAGFLSLDLLHLRHELFAGGMSPRLRRELFVQRAAVAVLPWDPRSDQVVLVEQFRAGLVDESAGAWSLEAVAGLLDAGERPEHAARREVREECGLEVERLAPAGVYHSSPGASSERVTCYVAEVAARVPDLGATFGLAAEHEDIRVVVAPFSEALGWLEAGRITAANTVVPMQWLALRRDHLRAGWLAAAADAG